MYVYIVGEQITYNYLEELEEKKVA
jgi:hypothetical protein